MITKNIYIEDLVERYPELISPLADFGLFCLRCGEPVWGTLEELAEEKNLQERLDEIVNQLNDILKTQTK